MSYVLFKTRRLMQLALIGLAVLVYLLAHLGTLRPYIALIDLAGMSPLGQGTLLIPIILAVILLYLLGHLSFISILLALIAASISICIVADAIAIYLYYEHCLALPLDWKIALNCAFVTLGLGISLLLLRLFIAVEFYVLTTVCAFYFALHAFVLKVQLGLEYPVVSFQYLPIWLAPVFPLMMLLIMIGKTLYSRFVADNT